MLTRMHSHVQASARLELRAFAMRSMQSISCCSCSRVGLPGMVCRSAAIWRAFVAG